jgi:transitional endoplasmic reticulum ATPase
MSEVTALSARRAAPVPVALAAARPAPRRPLGPRQAELPSAGGFPAEAQHSGHVARLEGPAGDIAYARIAVTSSGEGQPREAVRRIRLGRALWTDLRAKPGDEIRAEVLGVPECQQVVVQPSLALSDTLRDRAADGMRGSGDIVWTGAAAGLPLLGSGSEVMLTVTSCVPDPAVMGPGSRVEFAGQDPHDHQHGSDHQHGHDDVGSTTVRTATRADVGGASETLDRLISLLGLTLHQTQLYTTLGIRPPRGVLLYGPPGTGKTLLARTAASETGAHVIALAASDLAGTYSGETEANMRRLFQRAAEHAPTLILIDEVDVLITKRDRLASMADIRAASQLLTLMDGMGELGRVVVLGTTNRLAVVDEAFRRPGRFDVELPVLPPDENGRREIVAVHTRDMPVTQEAEEELEEFVVRGSAGMTGADLMGFAREVGLHAALRLSGAGHDAGAARAARNAAVPESLVAVERDDIAAARRLVSPSLLRGFRVSAGDDLTDWNQVIGLDDEKRQLTAVAEAVFSGGSRWAEGVLLHGSPGSGKSMLLRALAGHFGATYVEVDGTAVFTQWLGESEAELRAAFSRAREVRPVVIGLEHLEVLAPRRVTAGPGEATRAADRVLGALLSELDATLRLGQALVVGVTDRPDLVDPGVLRAGRLGFHIELGDLSARDRRELVAAAAGPGWPDADLESLAAETAAKPAAEVVSAVRRSRMARVPRASASTVNLPAEGQ